MIMHIFQALYLIPKFDQTTKIMCIINNIQKMHQIYFLKKSEEQNLGVQLYSSLTI